MHGLIGTLIERPARYLLVSALLLVTALSLGLRGAPETVAQDTALATHPLVGAWVLDVDTTDPTNTPTLAIFSSDGIYWQADPDGTNGYGAWEATGERTANLTFLFQGEEDGAYLGAMAFRASIEVADDGDSITASYTMDIIAPDGTSTGEMGPGLAEARRIAVEAPGTPVAPLGPGEGAPEATPAS